MSGERLGLCPSGFCPKIGRGGWTLLSAALDGDVGVAFRRARTVNKFRESIPRSKAAERSVHLTRFVATYNFPCLERVNSGHTLPDDQGVNVVRAFVGLY
jgi:hypothetical protein